MLGVKSGWTTSGVSSGGCWTCYRCICERTMVGLRGDNDNAKGVSHCPDDSQQYEAIRIEGPIGQANTNLNGRQSIRPVTLFIVGR
ncbi:Hypothetical protein NTJ_15815 [Nesidiocoris tenuis]|uniref:Uncharacterized protein n=1 Tax=Nesidiocoris tenuis TaxID=355587 RepID=A0ABN7BF83_9HEMI|nr:Hypothetical protein NTJ_15815 [Nesidiocoris tenuis]